jgi:aminoglycoside phosphotransferase (APT) family kinase protein
VRLAFAGGTVRRPAGEWTPAVQALLRHFELVGFEGAPRPLGTDGACEIISYVEGEPSQDPSDAVLFRLGALVRRMHDAQAGFVAPPDARWQRLPDAVPGDEVICHNDLLGPNVLFRGGDPVAFVDWELAAPGLRPVDLVAPASYWVPLGEDDDAARHGMPTDRRPERLRLLLAGYGREGDRPFLDLVAAVWRSWVAAYRRWGGDQRRPSWAEAYDAGRCEYLERNLDWLSANREALA